METGSTKNFLGLSKIVQVFFKLCIFVCQIETTHSSDDLSMPMHFMLVQPYFMLCLNFTVFIAVNLTASYTAGICTLY